MNRAAFLSVSARFGAVALALAAAGCRTGTLPDPNDPVAGLRDPQVLKRNLKAASDMLNERKARGEIDERQYRALIAEQARKLLSEADLRRIPDSQAWQYAEVLITAEQWDQALVVLKQAVKHAQEHKIRDRAINDTLRLARVYAEKDLIPQAIGTARSLFDVPPVDKAPILPAVLYEIVPAARGKGHDRELAELLEGAIGQHEAVIVDPKLENGQVFLVARPHHLQKGWEEAARLYERAGDLENARRAALEAERVRESVGRL